MDLKALRDTPPWEWPRSTGAHLLDLLRNDRAVAPDRLLAAGLAGDLTVMNDELALALLPILRSRVEPAELRCQAAISLGPVLEQADLDGFEDPEAVPITERTFGAIQEALREVYGEPDVPEDVRRRALEVSVCAPEDWHADAIQTAYSNADAAWKLTAVFCMRFVRGFEAQIIEALGSKESAIHYEAVCAAGRWELTAAWQHVAALVIADDTDKELRLAAIDAIASINPEEALFLLSDLVDSPDEDIAAAAEEAMVMAEAMVGEGEQDVRS